MHTHFGQSKRKSTETRVVTTQAEPLAPGQVRVCNRKAFALTSNNSPRSSGALTSAIAVPLRTVRGTDGHCAGLGHRQSRLKSALTCLSVGYAAFMGFLPMAFREVVIAPEMAPPFGWMQRHMGKASADYNQLRTPGQKPARIRGPPAAFAATFVANIPI